ncbi:hypothetical protein H109_05352 [Trichophyton interdigitale MR816]|uniref:Uncharacterized protein n=1 Tax=Trichophyton interdigitale (strain MR816) TaxID=1215338 RepID=A0A059J4G9_TRIIM|nr:hypothetical protein H101_02235 [Trichophyton interdigitale H6]KDB22730.1 hypothetical protein H109_05352 [Trichophyton interdigitale MR816]
MTASNAKLLCSARMVSVSAPKTPVEATCKSPKQCKDGQCVCPKDTCGDNCKECKPPMKCKNGQCSCPLGTCGNDCKECKAPKQCQNGQCVCSKDTCGADCKEVRSAIHQPANPILTI